MEDKLKIDKNSKLFALLLNIYNPKENVEISQNYFKSENPSDLIKFAQETECDILALRFNITDSSEIESAKKLLTKLLPQITKPLMICGCGDDEIDKKLLPNLIEQLDRTNCIISCANEATYKYIIPKIIKKEQYIVLKSPIDINLAKELNILSTDLGLDLDKIIINADIGGLGYGYEYGYSIMEKINIEGASGDKYLNLPILSEASTEALKTKEAKSNEYQKSWGILETRARMIELSACSGVLSAGANIIIMNIPQNIPIMKGLV